MRSDRAMTRSEFLACVTSAAVLAVGGRAQRAFGMAVDRLANRNIHHGGGRPTGFPHPDPRPGITAEHVLPIDQLGHDPEVLAAYAAARAYPAIFDGLYCACECRDSMGHRSLLSCFESRQPTGCAGCREQALLVGRLAKEGRSLADVRQAIDHKYGG